MPVVVAVDLFMGVVEAQVALGRVSVRAGVATDGPHQRQGPYGRQHQHDQGTRTWSQTSAGIASIVPPPIDGSVLVPGPLHDCTRVLP